MAKAERKEGWQGWLHPELPRNYLHMLREQKGMGSIWSGDQPLWPGFQRTLIRSVRSFDLQKKKVIPWVHTQVFLTESYFLKMSLFLLISAGEKQNKEVYVCVCVCVQSFV